MNKSKFNQRYFTEAAHLANERFAGVDGFDNMVGGFRYADGDNGGATVQRFDVGTSQPYEILVVNANTTATDAQLFNSYVNRTSTTFNQNTGITITSTISGTNYTSLLAQTESKNFECGMTYIENIGGTNSGIANIWSLVTKDASGIFNTVTKSPKINPMQNQLGVLVYENTFKIDGYTSITISIPASSSLKYTFYPSATVASGRVLGNGPVMREYGSPNITPAQQIQLSASALSALRG